jgi:hypothetical protein
MLGFSLASFGIAKKLLKPLIIVTVIGGLITAGTIYINNKDNKILELTSIISNKQVEINQLNNNITTLEIAVKKEKINTANVKFEKQISEEQIANLQRNNKIINGRLRRKEKKTVSRDLSKLKNSRHRELVLKIINKSIKKQNKVFTNEE